MTHIRQMLTASMNLKVLEADEDFDELQELFIEGNCHIFAEALQKAFGYQLGAATTDYDDEFVLVHAFAVKDGKVIDFNGPQGYSYSIEFFIEANPGLHIDNIQKEIPCPKANWQKILKMAEARPNADYSKLAESWINKYKSFYTV